MYVSILLRVRLGRAKEAVVGREKPHALECSGQNAPHFGPEGRMLPYKKKSLPHFVVLNYYLQIILSG